jgi:hypothetical protein
MSDVSLAFNVVGRDRGVNALLSRTVEQRPRLVNGGGRGHLRVAGGDGVGRSRPRSPWPTPRSSPRARRSPRSRPRSPVACRSSARRRRSRSGIGAAWKATGQAATGGGGAVQERRPESGPAGHPTPSGTPPRPWSRAKRDEADATKAVNAAREHEGEAAPRPVAQPRRAASTTRPTPPPRWRRPPRISRWPAPAARTTTSTRLTRAYRQGAAPPSSRRRTAPVDLAEEQADGAKKGVEGSDAVQEALKRQQADAHDQVTRRRGATRRRAAESRDVLGEVRRPAGSTPPRRRWRSCRRTAGRSSSCCGSSPRRGRAPPAPASRPRSPASPLTCSGCPGIYLPMATRWLTRMGGSFNTAIRQSLGLAADEGHHPRRRHLHRQHGQGDRQARPGGPAGASTGSSSGSPSARTFLPEFAGTQAQTRRAPSSSGRSGCASPGRPPVLDPRRHRHAASSSTRSP